MTAIEPFKIAVSDAALTDLRERLARTRFPDPIPHTGWDYGTEPGYLRDLCDYWRETYDWRAWEARLNRFAQYRTEIQGVGVHFIHVRSRHQDAMPLIVTHGWPGSIFEFYKIIEPLTDPAAHGGGAGDAFHVVCPSIPGYGFSDAPPEPGWDCRKMAEINVALMARLGYARYGAQGGDWGAMISTFTGILDAPHCAGIHLNMAIASPPKGGDPRSGLTEKELDGLRRFSEWRKNETGYQAIQGTKPQTLGYGLNDSPAGLAAWIIEKFRTWSDCGGDIEARFSRDELLTNIMIYWVSQSITSSARLYCESMRAGSFGSIEERVDVPTGIAVFPGELMHPPRAWVERTFNVTRWTEMPSGGHFAALEEPARLVEDVRAFFRDYRTR
jgi:pimeloyl-ACP methyl ester carboxylesterase